MSNLAQRVWSSVILATIFLAATIAGGAPFVVLVTIMASIFWAEWTDMKMPGRDDRLQMTGILALIAIALVVLVLPPEAVAPGLVAVLAGFSAVTVLLRDPRGIGGFVYAALLLAALALLRGEWGDRAGLVAILFLVAIVWATDIGAYFVGRSVGGPKLAPRVSPKKTISGAIGGLGAAVAAGVLVHLAFGVRSAGTAALLAILLSVLAQAGDLFESWIKRRAGVKDSSNVIPGHGGMMDRVDGLVFAAIGLWVAGAASAGIATPSRAFF
ncbi:MULTISPECIES: phosphatidate cytidylyltransferase [unclassified Roseitalea]|uniref:phosphatidate cytidylyltransferase n=1 Tax=unclassified Roseitalea TaxID=2639107 RepID=UPI00273E4034|nr:MULTISPECIES: phosphatidate cytidylyltransferase [unclassified Roseitalea]